MRYALGEEHEQIRQAARQFAERELAPRAIEVDLSGEFPEDNVEKLRKYGYLGMNLPEEFGGGGMDMLSHTVAEEEIARCCAATAVIMSVHNILFGETVLNSARGTVREEVLRQVATGERLGAFALTEPEAGSDAGAITTTAVREGAEYVLNGRKTFISNAGVAHWYIVCATMDRSKGTKGITAFLVEKGQPGFSFGKPEDKMGIRGSKTADLILDGVRVREARRLGEEGEGFKIAMGALDHGRIGIAAQALGIAQAALDASVNYAKQRVQFGKPIATLQAIQWMIAEMAVDIEAARLLVYRAAELAGQPGRHSEFFAMAKLFASTTAMKHTVKAVQVHGGYGYMREYKVERLMRDAKITEIYEGTSEIMKLIIAQSLLR
ncbi:MAG: acyl-CoA dehydrogenase family protein [bacterium]|nr:acyl-CoA dehydrogenase family protein [bacterium]